VKASPIVSPRKDWISSSETGGVSLVDLVFSKGDGERDIVTVGALLNIIDVDSSWPVGVLLPLRREPLKRRGSKPQKKPVFGGASRSLGREVGIDKLGSLDIAA
jgi:hypothetical protein